MNNHVQILIAEDDEDDRQMLKYAFEKASINNPLNFVDDGEEVLEYLKAAKAGGNGYMPGIIIMDLNMPKMGGHETLKRLKNHNEWKKIPVIIFSTSDYKEDIRQCYLEGAASYLIKPPSYQNLVILLESLSRYWFQSVTLPEH
jgi:CheY-like chemotaxis protein